MTPREQIIAVLRGEQPDIIPSYRECPMDVTVFDGLLPELTGDMVKDQLAFTKFFDNCVCDINVNGQGIGLTVEEISRTPDEYIYRFETGAVWRESYEPVFCREALSYPINSPEDALSFKMPDARLPGRFVHDELIAAVNAFHDAGYFVEADAMGAWYGTYYFLTSFENILMWMAVEPDAAHAVFDMTSKFSLDSARQLLEAGVDCIATASDLGSGNGLLFSRDMFAEYVLPWLRELACLCHSYGAYLHLHSHGHIEALMDDIVGAGVDIINPIGPSDHNDLNMFKKKWGDKITIYGGIDTKIHQMTDEQMAEHIRQVVQTGRVGGRFFPRTESGIPMMPLDKTRRYIELLQKERRHGYC